MSHEAIEPLIPWYANGTLEKADCRRVEDHLRRCARCRSLVDQAREQQRALRSEGFATRTEEVHPRLLVEYADEPDDLDPETREWVERTLGRSAVSREALERLRGVPGPEERRPIRSPAKSPGLWQSFAASFLRPVPALAYLVLLVLLVPSVWMLRGRAVPDAAPSRVVAVTGERALRTDRSSTVPPLEVDAGAGPVVLELQTELSASDLRGLEASFDLQILRQGRVVWSESVGVEHFRIREGLAIATIVLDPGRFPPGRLHEVALRAHRPGDPVHGQALFRRAFVLAAD